MASTKTKAKGTAAKAVPFPFFGSGVAQYYKSASLLVWFERGPADDERASLAALLPGAFRAFEPERFDDAWLLETDDTLDLEVADDAAWATLAEETRDALLQIHARAPIAFAAKELADEGGHALDEWHTRSVKALAAVTDRVLAAPAASFLVGLRYVLPYASERAFSKLSNGALDRFAAMLRVDDRDARAGLSLCEDLLETLDAKKRAAFERGVAPVLRVALAASSLESRRLFVADDGAALVRAAAGAAKDPSALRDDVERLCDRLVSDAIAGKREARGPSLSVAMACSEVEGACSDAQRVLVHALRGEHDRVLPLLDGAARDAERHRHAIATALAEAVRDAHRPVIDACVAHVERDPSLLEDAVVVANVLVELLARSRHVQAAKLARAHVEAERGLTPALCTNLVLAFAQAGEADAVPRGFAELVAERLQADDGEYFVTDEADLRGSAHAWLALWWGVVPDLARARAHLEKARATKYADFAVLPNHPLFVRLKGDAEITSLFASSADAAIEEKNAAIAKNPRDWWAIFSRGLLFHERGDVVRAMTDYEATIALNPTYPDVYINIGNIHWVRDKNFAEAIRFYDKALTLAPKHFFARLNRAEARLNKDDAKGALDDATRALAIQPSPHAIALRALANARLGKGAAAKKDAREALAKDAKLSSIDHEAWREEIRAAAT